MIVCFKRAIPREDYPMDIIMNNGNRLLLNMAARSFLQ